MTLARRTEHVLLPEPRRVLVKPYLPGEEPLAGGGSRAALLMERVLRLSEDEVDGSLAELRACFSVRHPGLEEILERHFGLVAHLVPGATDLSPARRLWIGACFTHEYSVEAAALCNPSIVSAPDQRGVPPGRRRFVMSARAIGEGHISSIEFRTGTLDETGAPTFDPVGTKLVGGHRTPPETYERRPFAAKLVELGAGNDVAWGVLDRLADRFTLDDLEQSLGLLQGDSLPQAITHQTAMSIRVLAASSYVTRFPADAPLSERIIFPAGPNETRGMEDARFVRFVEEDGAVRYYATYTAFDGFEILPQLLETSDFESFAISTLHGAAAQNKGMALFPRRIDGKYVMLSRKDRENLHLSTSTDVRSWNDVVPLRSPAAAWEILQIGNCGSPLETSAGWLVLTHGVGPMRRYSIGALLLDLDEPDRVLGCLPVPLLTPNDAEREGYVPNVLYSCGSMLHGDTLVLPYGFSDRGIRIALVSVSELLAALGGGDRRRS